MRQAGRYLPEYRELRQSAENFLDFCYRPKLAAEATLQPIRRYGMDAAIVFSDILVVPHALGMDVTFETGRGPVLDAIGDAEGVKQLRAEPIVGRLNPVYETLATVRAELDKSTALIGFAGAPWTIATYMVEGGSSRDFATIKRWAFGDPDGFGGLIDRLVETISAHLIAQADAGADAVQIFDTWAGVLPENAFKRWCVEPVKAIVDRVRQKRPDLPIIGFPRGAGLLYQGYAAATGVNGVSIDSAVPTGWARDVLQKEATVQGNLDPQILVVGGDVLRAEVDRILRDLGNGRHIFNLGHGVVPETPPENVALLTSLLRGD
jgi:uroporphyrinogen decarboxylase